MKKCCSKQDFEHKLTYHCIVYSVGPTRTASQNSAASLAGGVNGNMEPIVYENLGASQQEDPDLSDHILLLKKKIDGFAEEFSVRTI